MAKDRYDYLPGGGRGALKWPGEARLALWVCPNIEYFHIDKPQIGRAACRERV